MTVISISQSTLQDTLLCRQGHMSHLWISWCGNRRAKAGTLSCALLHSFILPFLLLLANKMTNYSMSLLQANLTQTIISLLQSKHCIVGAEDLCRQQSSAGMRVLQDLHPLEQPLPPFGCTTPSRAYLLHDAQISTDTAGHQLHFFAFVQLPKCPGRGFSELQGTPVSSSSRQVQSLWCIKWKGEALNPSWLSEEPCYSWLLDHSKPFEIVNNSFADVAEL